MGDNVRRINDHRAHTHTHPIYKATIELLKAKRQTHKTAMYQRLLTILTVTGVTVFLFMLANMIAFPAQQSVAWDAQYWQVYWFLRDGWMNIVYLIAFTAIIVLWRPTTNNARYGLEELPDNHLDAFDLEMMSPTVASNVDQQQSRHRSGYASPLEAHGSGAPNDGRVLFDVYAGRLYTLIFASDSRYSDSHNSSHHLRDDDPAIDAGVARWAAKNTSAGVYALDGDTTDDEEASARHSSRGSPSRSPSPGRSLVADQSTNGGAPLPTIDEQERARRGMSKLQ